MLNKQAHYYTQHYDLIGIEDLPIPNMVHNKHLSKSILDQGWGYFKRRLLAKAVNAGRQLVLVNPAFTSQHSFCCGVPFPEFDLSIRQVTCPRCVGLTPVGRATVSALHLADDPDALLVRANRVIAGWHPPT